MKSNKGITLTSLIVYMMAMMIILGVISTITIYFHKNTQAIKSTTDNSRNLTRINEYMLHDIQNCENAEVTAENKITITQKNGDIITYTYVNTSNDKSIYRNKVKICDEIHNCTFEEEAVYDKTKIILNVTIGETEIINKTMEYVVNN